MPKPKHKYSSSQTHFSDYHVPILKKQIAKEKRKLVKLKEKLKIYKRGE